MTTYTIAEINDAIARLEAQMAETPFNVYPSPVRAMDVGTLLNIARYALELQARIDAALAIEPLCEALMGEPMWRYEQGYNAALDDVRKALTSD